MTTVGLKRGAVSAGRPPSVSTAALKRTCATVWHFGLDNCWAVALLPVKPHYAPTAGGALSSTRDYFRTHSCWLSSERETKSARTWWWEDRPSSVKHGKTALWRKSLTAVTYRGDWLCVKVFFTSTHTHTHTLHELLNTSSWGHTTYFVSHTCYFRGS